MKDREIKARGLLKQKLSELEDAKENAGEALRQECEKETAELLEKVRDLSLLIKEKNDEIDKMREEKKKAERMYEGRQAEVNAVVLKMKEYKETCRSFVVQLCRPEVLVSAQYGGSRTGYDQRLHQPPYLYMESGDGTVRQGEDGRYHRKGEENNSRYREEERLS